MRPYIEIWLLSLRFEIGIVLMMCKMCFGVEQSRCACTNGEGEREGEVSPLKSDCCERWQLLLVKHKVLSALMGIAWTPQLMCVQVCPSFGMNIFSIPMSRKNSVCLSVCPFFCP